MRKLTLIVWLVLLLVLISATIYEKANGTDHAYLSFYGTWWFVSLWCMAALLSLCYIIRRRLFKRPVLFMLHISFVVILAGAFLTYCTAKHGTIHVGMATTATEFTADDGSTHPLPLRIRLYNFNVVYYEGTASPADYVASVTVTASNGNILKNGDISMNNIMACKGYRFYQSGYDEDLKGCTFMLAHDPWGIGITYCGYTLLLISILLFIVFDPQYHTLVKNSFTSKITMLLLLLCTGCTSVSAHSTPNVLPKDVAAGFGNLYVYYNGRISPLQTLAKDFTVKLYGKSGYEGYTPEQVFTGWMFYYSDWKEQPMIKIKSAEARSILNLSNKYASLTDFRGRHNEYKLEEVMNHIARGTYHGDHNGLIAADEKFNLITSFYSGKLMKIYPHRSASDTAKIEWFSQGDRLPDNIVGDEWFFVKKSWDYVFELVINKKYSELSVTLDKIKRYQQNTATGKLPPKSRFEAEKIYNQYANVKAIAFPAIIIGIVLFAYFCFCTATKRKYNRYITISSLLVTTLMFTTLTLFIALRWVIGHHIPLSNGTETMQFMAWCTLLLTILLFRKYPTILPFGLIICGSSMMVSVMGSANPQITLLMPVLASPLLSIHVAVIMIAYALLAFMMFNGIVSVILTLVSKDSQQEILQMYSISRILLYPALFCLVTGIFIGAIWANISWGNYWSWDPKETWALITMLIYAVPLHWDSIPAFRRPMFFHMFTIVAFLTVLITYFGVNYFLGGMHSYAG